MKTIIISFISLLISIPVNGQTEAGNGKTTPKTVLPKKENAQQPTLALLPKTPSKNLSESDSLKKLFIQLDSIRKQIISLNPKTAVPFSLDSTWRALIQNLNKRLNSFINDSITPLDIPLRNWKKYAETDSSLSYLKKRWTYVDMRYTVKHYDICTVGNLKFIRTSAFTETHQFRKRNTTVKLTLDSIKYELIEDTIFKKDFIWEHPVNKQKYVDAFNKQYVRNTIIHNDTFRKKSTIKSFPR